MKERAKCRFHNSLFSGPALFYGDSRLLFPLKFPLHIKWTSWIGIAAIAVQLNAVPFSLLLFRLNQENIARTQCEHKMPHCNGNCYLMKQLAKTTGNQSDKKTERVGAQLDGQYLRSERNNLARFALDKRNTPILTAGNTLPGFPTKILQPPRFA